MREVSRYVIVGCSVLVAILAVNMTRGSDDAKTAASPQATLGDSADPLAAERLAPKAAASARGASDALASEPTSEEQVNHLALLHDGGEELASAHVDGAEDLPQLFDGLRQAPNDRAILDRLSTLHARGFERARIMALIEELALAHPHQAALAETLADLYVQQGTFAAAAENFRKVLQVSDHPMRVRTMLTFSLLRQGEFAQAIAVAEEQHRLAAEYLTGKRDQSQLQEKIEDEHLFIPCLFEAVALAKLDESAKARQVLDGCGQGVVADDTRHHFVDFANLDIDTLRDSDIATLLQ